MAKVICSICGAEEDSENYIPATMKILEKSKMCFHCYHWHVQHELDKQGARQFAIINGTHYVLYPHMDDRWMSGGCGLKRTIKFKDGRVETCDNLWCQGDIPSHWRALMPDNAEFIQ